MNKFLVIISAITFLANVESAQVKRHEKRGVAKSDFFNGHNYMTLAGTYRADQPNKYQNQNAFAYGHQEPITGYSANVEQHLPNGLGISYKLGKDVAFDNNNHRSFGKTVQSSIESPLAIQQNYQHLIAKTQPQPLQYYGIAIPKTTPAPSYQQVQVQRAPIQAYHIPLAQSGYSLPQIYSIAMPQASSSKMSNTVIIPVAQPLYYKERKPQENVQNYYTFDSNPAGSVKQGTLTSFGDSQQKTYTNNLENTNTFNLNYGNFGTSSLMAIDSQPAHGLSLDNTMALINPGNFAYGKENTYTHKSRYY